MTTYLIVPTLSFAVTYWGQAASHKSLSIPDLMYHSQQIDFDGMRRLCADIMPYEWSHMDEPMVWFEMESNARYPAFHTGCVMGKS